MKKKYVWMLLLLLPVSSHAGGDAIAESYDAADAATVYLENRSGSVAVRGWQRDEVSVAGTLGDAERIEVRWEGRRLIVRAVYPSSWLDRVFHSVRGERGASLEVRVPNDVALVVNVLTAEVSTSGLSGSQRLASVGGDLRAALAAGGTVVATSVSGDIHLAGHVGELADLHSASGDIVVQAEVASGSKLLAATASGDVTLLFDGDAAGRYAVETASGRVDTCFGTTHRRFDPWGVEQVRFVEGRAGKTVHVSTSSGDVAVCRT